MHFATRGSGQADKVVMLTRSKIKFAILGWLVVEVVALALNGVLYDLVLRSLPGATHLYWLVRLATSNVVFLLWSYPLWRRVFRTPTAASAH